MRDRKMLDMMGLADDKYVTEADPSRPSPLLYSRTKFKWSTFFAVACCLLLVLNIAIFLPYLNKDESDTTTTTTAPTPDIEDGFNQIQNPSANGGTQGGNTTIVDKNQLFDTLEDYFGSSLLPPEAEGESSTETSAPIGDISQKTNTHIYYLKGTNLIVYPLDSSSSTDIITFPLAGYIQDMIELGRALTGLPGESDTTDNYAYNKGWEMIISKDKSSLIILAKGGSYPVTGVFSFDISSHLKLDSFKIFSGEYVSAASTQNGIFLFTEYQISRTFDKERPTSYMPFYRQNGEDILLNNIYFPKEINSSSYLNVARLDNCGGAVLECAAYLSYSDKVYVSENTVFLTRPVFTGDINIDYKNPPYKTEITAFSYSSDSFKALGTISINGLISSSGCLDESGGVFRVATTSYITKSNSATVWYEKSVSLFLIDAGKMELLARAENVATEREYIYSVTFNSSSVYILTTEDGVTPKTLLSFDLTENEISYESGEPSSTEKELLDFGNGYLLYIGAGSNSQTLKIEVYRRTLDELICSYELSNTYFPTDKGAYLIDISQKLVGFAVKAYTQGVGYEDKYILLSFSESKLEPVFSQPISYSTINSVRGFYQGTSLYIVTDTAYYSYEIV